MSWGRQYEARKRISKRYKTVYRLPVWPKLSRILQARVPAGARVLDVGAGDRSVARHLPACDYKGLDPDEHYEQEFRSLAEPGEGSFDVVLWLEVIEHLPLEEALFSLERMREILKPGGLVVVTTPNTFHPQAYLRDATHRTPFCYDELGGILEVAGFEVEELCRVHHDAVWRKFLRRFVFGWLFWLLSLDYAAQVVAVARRPC